mmetsp:Transcript_47255/g.121573  ORF Transcript_47255/g.121573 Transcript_47255/m.121573 type:complete len:290 (-) Transcript_47255:548-1417(-)
MPGGSGSGGGSGGGGGGAMSCAKFSAIESPSSLSPSASPPSLASAAPTASNASPESPLLSLLIEARRFLMRFRLLQKPFLRTGADSASSIFTGRGRDNSSNRALFNSRCTRSPHGRVEASSATCIVALRGRARSRSRDKSKVFAATSHVPDDSSSVSAWPRGIARDVMRAKSKDLVLTSCCSLSETATNRGFDRSCKRCKFNNLLGKSPCVLDPSIGPSNETMALAATFGFCLKNSFAVRICMALQTRSTEASISFSWISFRQCDKYFVNLLALFKNKGNRTQSFRKRK